MKAKNIHVTKRHDNQWQGIGEGNIRPYFVAETQKQAQQKAREIALERKVEVLIHGVDGKIRARDSYGNDPYPPQG